jgi:hypothetical protein
MVLELVAGQKVTYDDATGNYWYYILADFANKTYGEQTEAIDDLGTYGNIDGGWHMATPEEWAELWDEYAGKSVEGLFEPTFDGVTGKAWMGRSEDFIIAGFPYKTYIHGGIAIRTSDGITYDWDEGPSHFDTRDSETATFLGAWVVSDQAVVPAPGALVLAATGLLSSTLGLNRLRRKHQEPSQI